MAGCNSLLFSVVSDIQATSAFLIPYSPTPPPSMLTLLEALHSTVGSVRADARRNQKHVTGAVAGSHSADCGKAQ